MLTVDISYRNITVYLLFLFVFVNISIIGKYGEGTVIDRCPVPDAHRRQTHGHAKPVGYALPTFVPISQLLPG